MLHIFILTIAFIASATLLLTSFSSNIIVASSSTVRAARGNAGGGKIKHGKARVTTLEVVSNDDPDHMHSLCFTQGLVHHEDYLIESCGLFKKSRIQKVNPKTGAVILYKPLPADIFAEGLVAVGRYIYMLTWKNGLIYIFDVASLEVVKTLPIISTNGEGWGLTFDGQYLILSDGSHILTYLSISNSEINNGKDIYLTKIKEVSVFNPAGAAVKHLNELEFVDGLVFANVWYQDYIVAVDRESGIVARHIDLTSLYPKGSRSRSADCLNGIAYNGLSKTFTLTGKQWPSYFVVDINISKHNREGGGDVDL